MLVQATDPSSVIWTYEAHDDDKFGSYATCHLAVSDDGKVRTLPWSPYQTYGPEHFRAYVSAGFPSKQVTNWTPAEIAGLQLQQAA